MYKEHKIKKKYYSPKEAQIELGVSQSILWHYDNLFKLGVRRDRKNARQYTKEDLETFKLLFSTIGILTNKGRKMLLKGEIKIEIIEK